MLSLFTLLILAVAAAGLMIWARENVQCDFPFKLTLAFVLVLTQASFALCAEMIPAHTSAPVADLSPWPAALVGLLRDTVFPIISAFVLGIFSLFLNRLGQKYKVQVLTEKNNFLFRLAAQGIALAEERAAKLAGSVSQLTGSQKLDIAVAHMVSFAPKISPQQAQDIVHSVLAQIPGAGATREAVTLLPQEGGYSIPIPYVGEIEEAQAIRAAKPPARD